MLCCARVRRTVGRAAAVSLVCALAAGLSGGSGAPTASARAGDGVQPAAQQAPAGVPEGSSETDALDEAKRTGERVEVMSLRGESSEVFATPEGLLEAREHLRPVWARKDGTWKAVDTSLVASDGTVAPRASTTELSFSGGGEGPLVHLARAGRALELSWPGAVPAPTLADDTATYADIIPGADLRLTATPDGFTQLLVVKSAEAANSPRLAELRLRFLASGMAVRETPEGGIEAVDRGAGGVVFEAPTPVMWDSSPGEATDASSSGASARSVPQAGTGGSEEPGAGESGQLARVGVDVPAGGGELVLTPDRDVLAGEDTVYPVFIDPQWYSPKASAWTMASKYWAGSPQWKFNGDSDAGLGYCGWVFCKPYDTKRLFYQIPTSRFAGEVDPVGGVRGA